MRVVRGERLIDALPPGTVVALSHPLWRGPGAFVRVELADGSLAWEGGSLARVVTTSVLCWRYRGGGVVRALVLAEPGEVNSSLYR